MGTLTEVAQWEAGIDQYEEGDLLRGGPGRELNRAPQKLANRTAYLKELWEAGVFERDEPGPVLLARNGANSTYVEFARDGYDVRGSVGALGNFETNLSFNMDYRDGVHRLYDPSLDAVWFAMNETGVYLQYAPATDDPGDVWEAADRLYNWYVKNDGKLYGRGNAGFGDEPVDAARVYAKGSGSTSETLGLYSMNAANQENFKQFDDGTLWNRGNVGFGFLPLAAARLAIKSETDDIYSYAMYVVDAENAEILHIYGNGLLQHFRDAVIGGVSSEISFYGHATTGQQLLATGVGHTSDDIILTLQRLGLVRQS